MADEPVSAWREPLVAAGAAVGAAEPHGGDGGGGGRAGRGGRAVGGAGRADAGQRPTRRPLAARPANAALAAANAELSRSKAAVQARYDLAVEAIKTFHTGVSEDFLLKEEQFKELRDRLLKSAADFYGKLGRCWAGSGPGLAAGARRADFELAELTGKVGRQGPGARQAHPAGAGRSAEALAG